MKIVNKLISGDGLSQKQMQLADDGAYIESAYFNLDEHVFCISSQVGCPLGCSFCASGSAGFFRNLRAVEIVQQVENIIISIAPLEYKKLLFSFTGSGEPLLNYSEVMAAAGFLCEKYDNPRITISTTGVAPDLIRKLARELPGRQVQLHLSLHAPDDELRCKLMPNAGNIAPALDALEFFAKERRVTPKVNYVLIKGVNDSREQAIELAKLLQSRNVIAKLGRLNPFSGYLPSEQFQMFEEVLSSYGVKSTRFASIGTDIWSGCGQLRCHLKDHPLPVLYNVD